ncbi:MAG: hypothetical protein HPY53_01680 [Brevinematales bacterium]|nr:hypothetical protein [Brevinematales bacterium]
MMDVREYKKLPKEDRVAYLKSLDKTERNVMLKKIKKSIDRGMRDQVMRDMGLTKVRGAVSGKVFWE